MNEPEPLPLEDAPPRPNPAALQKSGSKSRWRSHVVWLSLCVIIIPITFGLLRFRYYGHRLITSEHKFDDGDCKASLPGNVVSSPWNPPASFGVALPGLRFQSSSAFAHLRGSVGWLILDPEKMRTTRDEDLLAGLIAQRTDELKIPVVKIVPMKYIKYEGFEVHYGKDRDHWTEQYILVSEPRPRLYSVGAGGRDFPPDSPAVRKVIQSFELLK